MQNYNFKFFGDIFLGPSSINNLYDIIKKKNYSSAAIIIDHNLVSIKPFVEIINKINENIKSIIIECNYPEPTYEMLDSNRIDKSIEVDVFIGIGGGSAMDMAKGLAVLYTNEKPAIFYRGFDKFENIVPPIIAIPTTAGTGSEITPNASFIDTNEKRKMGINGEAIRPKFAILDPQLTLSCPKAPTISACVDSMVHATEAFVAKSSNPMAKMFAREGFQKVFKYLPVLINDLENIDLRQKVMHGAFLSAIALMNSGTGPAAAMSYPLGVHFGVPHGIGGGIFLPHVIQHNIDSGYFEYIRLSIDRIDIQDEKKIANEFIEELWNIWELMEIPQDLKKFGMNENHVQKFLGDTMDLKGALDQNPVPFYENEIKMVLKKLNIG